MLTEGSMSTGRPSRYHSSTASSSSEEEARQSRVTGSPRTTVVESGCTAMAGGADVAVAACEAVKKAEKEEKLHG